jgi:L-alanine-DL-glutamate epimerase-like enolase superfamily enzyme
MIGGMLESSLAMTTSAHLAAGLGCFKYIDLDTPFFLKEGVKNPYLNSRGIYDLQKVKAGIGINIK